jgi:hypothetical protein
MDAGHRFDAPHAGGETALGVMRSRPISPVRATCVPPHSSTEKRSRAHGQHAHLVAVLLAEQRHGAGGTRRVHGHQLRAHRRIGADLRVNQVLDVAATLRVIMPPDGRIKTQALRIHQRAFLLTCSPSTVRSAACSRCVAE